MLYCGFRETEAAFTNSMSSQVDCICMSDSVSGGRIAVIEEEQRELYRLLISVL